jgi:hypothetical protein
MERRDMSATPGKLKGKPSPENSEGKVDCYILLYHDPRKWVFWGDDMSMIQFI